MPTMEVEVINLDSDDESTTSSCTIGRDEFSSPASSLSPSSTFGQDDFMADEDFEAYVNGLSNTTSSSSPESRATRRVRTVPAPAPAPRPVRVPINEINYQGRTYRPGKFVELHDGTFLRINRIFLFKEETMISGPKFERLETVGSLVPDRVNELCWMVDVGDTNIASSQFHSEEVEIPISLVRRLRIIRLTNHPYAPSTSTDNRDDGFLFCRMKYTRTWERPRTTSGRSPARIIDHAITYLTPEDCQPPFSVSRNFLRDNWRGKSAAGRRYTFGDSFCGAGG
ncbi:hypothetical protein FQN49_008428, partial [Arthroderma sp. PD_2]